MARADLEAGVGIRVRGLGLNAPLLIGVILSVALLDPHKAIPGTNIYPWVYLRETIQLVLIAISIFFGSNSIRTENRFNYHAIIEVAALFIGIFICMQPALEILKVYGPHLGINTPQKFFWITGGLSAVLDNAPTYVVFFETPDPQLGPERLINTLHDPKSAGYLDLMAISLGAVFMGAMTYIGNGPNFMVRAIAEESGVRMPSFFGFVIFYSLPILLPVMLLTALVFLW
jgi:Na+/H+ antiporter NhaD/arsenite permease-like protein